MREPLSILMMLHMPWDENLGGPRAQMELAAEFRKLGHRVEKFDLFDAFPYARRPSRITPLLRPSFALKSKNFVRANAGRFDIIDAHQGNLPFTKKELGFKGLLVARSVGLAAMYAQFAEFEKARWPAAQKGNPVANILRSWRRRRQEPNFLRSLQTCDLINLPNHDELDYVESAFRIRGKSRVIPLGLSPQRQEALAAAKEPAEKRLAEKRVVFVGSWSARKGAQDWSRIIKRIREEIPDARFLFLGTGFNEATVLADIELSARDCVEVIPSYENSELATLLRNATVGAFPSYIEGFGLAVLEKLAGGLPTVAYDVPGPREMLRHFERPFLTPPGDAELFGAEVARLLKLEVSKYASLSEHCSKVARLFSWPKIAADTLDNYISALEAVKRGADA